MDFFWVLLVTVQLYLTLSMAQDSEELYIVKDPSTNELTCMSKDDDAALAWNYDLSTNKLSDSLDNFEPVKPINQNVTRCAVWRSKQCLAAWEGLNDGNIVNSSSISFRMGPVVDYRWEGFNGKLWTDNIAECISSKLYVHKSFIVFSVRGTDDIRVLLCDYAPLNCFVITIAVKGRYSAIEHCKRYKNSNGQFGGYGPCQEIDKFEHKTPVLDAHEWRTFRFQWDVEMQLIQVFSDTKTEPFLQGEFIKRHDVCRIVIANTAEARMKFHHYNFIFPRNSTEILTTAPFRWNDQKFCVNMLVSLCPQCRFHVSLIGIKNGEELGNEIICGNPDFGRSELKLWQSIKLNMSLLSPISTLVRVKITLAVNGENDGDAWWAIDNLRSCEQNNGVRESTIQLPSSDKNTAEPHIRCQKLFHNRTVSVDSSKSKSYSTINQLRGCIRHQGKPYFSDYRNGGGVDGNSTNILSYQRFQCLPTENPKGFRGVKCNEALPGENKTWLVIIPILVICLLFSVLFIWHRRRGQVLLKTNHAQNISLSGQTNYIGDFPEDPVYSTISENLGDLETTSSRNVSSDPPYMIPIDWSNKLCHAWKVPSDSPYVNTPGSSKQQTSCPRGVPLKPVYNNIPEYERNQTSFLRDDSPKPLYMYIDSGDSTEDTSCPESSRSDPPYMSIPNDLREQTSHSTDAASDSLYLTFLDDQMYSFISK